MPRQHNFEHLPLILRERGRAKLKGGGKASPQTIANRNARKAHSTALMTAAQSLKTNWETIKTQSAEQGVPIIPPGIPILLKIDPQLDLDVLREKFEFEIVAEQEEGYVIVAAEDIELTPFIQMVNEFAVEIHGSARIAQIHRLFDNPEDRLRRILSDRLLEIWPTITDAQTFIVDIGIACSGTYIGVKDHLDAGRPYPRYLYEDSARVANPAQSLQALTVGSIAYGAFDDGAWRSFGREDGHPSAFSRSGPGIWNVIKPEVVEYGGDDSRTSSDPVDVRDGGIAAACPELVRSTMFPPGPPYDRDAVGTSFATPKVARIAAKLEAVLPDEPALLYRALIVQSARWPQWAEALLTRLRQTADEEERHGLIEKVSRIIRCLGYGLPDVTRATTNTLHRTTFITSGQASIRPLDAHIYQVPIPEELRRAGDEYDIRIEVTLSYAAQPRRTRRHLRRYLSTWVDWTSSSLGESIGSFRVRAFKETPEGDNPQPGSTLPWVLQDQPHHGVIRDTKRNNGTVQKDWAVVKSHALPNDFCIAVRGHEGWSRDPDSTASYSLAVTFEILGQEIAIYDALRTAVIELQELEAEAGIEEIEAEAEQEVEIEVDE